MQRRRFVVATSAAVMGASLGVWLRARGREATSVSRGAGLSRDPRNVLDLSPGFSYRVVDRFGDVMSDGFRVPGRPDAMACFELSGSRWALMRNHELDRTAITQGPYLPTSVVPEQTYDPQSFGGVTRIVLDAHGRRLSSNLVLVGTARNCAGGVSPWGFLSCEENVDEGHGYVFLCSIQADSVRHPQRIRAYGRFHHEAAAIDVATSTAYLTEDRVDSCLYRFVPQRREDPFGTGRLQAMVVRGSPRFEVSESLTLAQSRAVDWVDVPPDAGENDDSLRYAAQERGAAIVRRGEGLWFAEDGLFFTSTSGGPLGRGQILHVALGSLHGQAGRDRLSLIAQSEDADTLDMPDNLTVTPWGDLLVCEDNQREAYLRLVTRSGQIIPFARNVASRSELAGACFSPDGRLLFVNIQEDGLTLAIEGPWHTLQRA